MVALLTAEETESQNVDSADDIHYDDVDVTTRASILESATLVEDLLENYATENTEQICDRVQTLAKKEKTLNLRRLCLLLGGTVRCRTRNYWQELFKRVLSEKLTTLCGTIFASPCKIKICLLKGGKFVC